MANKARPAIRRLLFLVMAVVLGGVALGTGIWYFFWPRTISVCVVSDYSFRQQHPDWYNLLERRFRKANRIFSATSVRWRFFQADQPDPTGNVHDVELRRRRLAHMGLPGDVVLVVSGQPQGPEAGDVVPFSHVAMVVDKPELSEAQNTRVFAHGMAALFGAPSDAAGAGTLMTVPPESDTVPRPVEKLIRKLRSYDFRNGTEALQGEWGSRALSALTDVYEGRPGNATSQAHRTLGMALAADENYKTAIAHLREVAKLEPASADAHLDLATVLSHDLQYQPAAAEFQDAVRLKPDWAEVRAGHAMALANSGRGDEAIDEFRAALRLKPDSAMAQAAMAYVLTQHLGRIDEAIAAYRKALEMAPRMEQAQQGLDRALAIKARAETALPQRRQRAQQAPSDPRAHFDLALSEARAGDVEGAIQEFRRTIALDPRNDRAHSNLAMLLYVRGDYAGAAREAQAAKDAGGSPPADLLDADKRKGGQ